MEKIPILKFPKSDGIIICSLFNKSNHTIDYLFINKNSTVLEKNKIDNWPLEKCSNCQYELSIYNTFFIDDNKISKAKFAFYLHKAFKSEETFINYKSYLDKFVKILSIYYYC